MQKVLNFRDLGGIATKDGRKVKKNLFYRSAMLNDATEEDIEYLKSLKIKIIFDYRDNDEIALTKTNPYQLIGVTHAHYPSDMQNQKLYKLKNSSHISRAFQKVTMDDVKSTYRNLPFNNIGYKAMVQALIAGNAPLYQHCTAGKDRAGMGSALLLGILGVAYEDIVEDYMKSVVMKEHIEERLGKFIPRFLRKLVLKRFGVLFTVEKELLDASYEAITEKYGSFEGYLLAEYNLDEKDIKQLREKYTE